MLLQFIENLLLGFAISAAPGAIFFETIRRALSKKESVIAFQLGNFLGVIIVAAVALAGVSSILSEPSYANVFYAISGLLLIYLGYQSLIIKLPEASEASKSRIKSNYKAVVSGATLAILNPLSIVFWVSLTGKFTQQFANSSVVLINTIAVITGALMLFVILISVVKLLGHKISGIHLIWLSKASGLIIIVYGLTTLFKLIID